MFYRHAKSVAGKLVRVCLLLLTAVALPSQAGKKIAIDDTHWISVGGGIRAAFTSTENGAANGDRKNDFDIQSIRLYFNGQVHENIRFTFNTAEIFSDGPVDVLDAFVQFEWSPEVNIWLGRIMTPSDRIEMNGPYYGLTWNQYTQPLFPSDQGGAAGTYGRDDGVSFWGASDKFQYVLGVFDGLEGFGNQADNLLFAARLAYNFLNKEVNPGYYTSSTYHGKLGNILTLGIAFQSQDGGSGSETTAGDFSGYTLDLLSETVGGNGGVLNIEAEYKHFDADFTVGTPTADYAADGEKLACFCLFDGDSYFLSVAYLFPGEGFGRFQPYVRFVENKPSDGANSDLTEVGLHYVIDAHKVRLNLNYSRGDAHISGYPDKNGDTSSISLGVQLQF